SWQVWAMIGMVLTLVFVLEGSYRAIRARDETLATRTAWSPGRFVDLLRSLYRETRMNLETESATPGIQVLVPASYYLDETLGYIRHHQRESLFVDLTRFL